MAVSTSVPTLDLVTAHERLNVKIDGVPYLIKSPNDLTLNDYSTIERLVPRAAVLVGQLSSETPLSADEEQELRAALTVLCQIALVAPPAILAKLGDLNRVLVFSVFTELLSPSLLRARANLGSRVGGTKPSRGSNGSMGATRRRGPGLSRSGISARTSA